MSREARAPSKTGIYHIMLRGINQQQIFQDDEDGNKFLQTLEECKEKSPYEIYAYCLMGNHIHLLMKETDVQIGRVMKMIASRFATWYNIKYQRVGHLFQDRFKSEPVESNEYFLTVLRYIHQNPIKAGLCKNVKEYKYSSYQEYIYAGKIVDKEFVYGIIEESQFEKFHEVEESQACMDVRTSYKMRITDEQAIKFVLKNAKITNLTEFQCLKEQQKEKAIKKLYSVGLSIRQISRMTGETKGMVEKWTKSM